MITLVGEYEDGREAGAEKILDQIRTYYWAAKIANDPIEIRFYERLLNRLIEGRKNEN